MSYYTKTDLIEGCYRIQFDSPLPQHSDQTIEAYSCISSKDSDKDYIAYILKTDYPPRLNIFKKMSKAFLSEEVKACVKIDYPIEGNPNYKYVVIAAKEKEIKTLTSALQYDEKLDKHFVASFAPINIKEHFIMMIGSLYKSLSYFKNVDIYHGNIRPDNIYFYSGNDFNTIRLGGCFLKPAGSQQPILYETINRGMCKPSLRGAGTSSDDIYSLGVSMLVFYAGEEPLRHLSEQEILLKKIDLGSYKLLSQGVEIPPEIAVFLKGALSDNESDRWDLEDIERWILTGRGRKVAIVQQRIKRGIQIGTMECFSKRSVSYAISQFKNETLTLLIDGKLLAWLDYACKDNLSKESLASLFEASQQGKISELQLITEICAILAPENPMFYSGIVFCPNSLSKVVLESIESQKFLKVIKDVLMNNLYYAWVSNQPLNAYLGQFTFIDKYRVTLIGQSINKGFEALFYSLNPNAYCMCKYVKKYKANTIPELLMALEKAATEIDIKVETPFDKELICFIDAKSKGTIPQFLHDLNNTENDIKRMNALVNLFAQLQERYLCEPLPKFSKWIGNTIVNNLKLLKDKDEFIKLNKLLNKKVKSGMLVDLIPFASEAIHKEDHIKFQYSKRLYAQLNHSIEEVQGYINDTELLHDNIGRPCAAYVSILVSLMIMTSSLFVLVG